jgi:outer membrane protein OmpA-like peptidoglycan-associated protein
LFRPLKQRGGVILFDNSEHELGAGAKQLIDTLWSDRRGARYFLIVGRASKTGTAANNRALSHRRANSLLFHIQEQTGTPEVEQQIGLLWLGSEFAQLPPDEYCSFRNSSSHEPCEDESINRSAFASWVDCRL